MPNGFDTSAQMCPRKKILKNFSGVVYDQTKKILDNRSWLLLNVDLRGQISMGGPSIIQLSSHQQKMFFLAAFLTLWLYCSEVQWGAFKNFNGIPPIQQLIDSLIQVAWNVLFLWNILDLFYFQTAIDACRLRLVICEYFLILSSFYKVSLEKYKWIMNMSSNLMLVDDNLTRKQCAMVSLSL